MMFHKSAVALALGAAFVATAPSASAAIFTVTGNTTGKPTFNRPIEDLSVLSGTGTAVRYDTLTFTVSLTGNYTFATTGDYISANASPFDTFVFLYRTPFNPASPLTNAIVSNDDLATGFFNLSGFGAALTAGTSYTYVTTGFSNTDFGSYSTTIGGPGVVTVIPEPQTAALFGLGLGVVSLLRRRRGVSAEA